MTAPLASAARSAIGEDAENHAARGVARETVMLVTDPWFGDDAIVRCVKAVGAALPKGAFAVQLRDKHRPRTSLRAFAAELLREARAVGARLIVNGDPTVAREVGADGVHLGRAAPSVAEARAIAGTCAWISVAAHSDEDVRRAADEGADAVLVSPVFPSRSPSGHGDVKAPRGLDAMRSARSIAPPRLALYALGGITAENASLCASAGADGVALIRGLLSELEPAAAARGIHDAFAGR
jgi:thiamine-phosphate pyrophosphorylase